MTSHDLTMNFAPTSELMEELQRENSEWLYEDPATPTDGHGRLLSFDEVRENLALAILDSMVTFVREHSKEAAQEMLRDRYGLSHVMSLIGSRLVVELELPIQWCNAMAEVLAKRLISSSLQDEILALYEVPRLAPRSDSPEPLLDLTDITLKRLAEDS